MATIDRRQELLIVQQVSGPLLADLDRLERTLEENRGGFRTGHEANPRPVDPDTDEDDREDSEWDQTSAAALSPDKARIHSDRLDVILKRMRDDVEEADYIRRVWMKDSTPAAGRQTPRCDSCIRENTRQPIRVANTRVAARLAEPLDLCDWCYRFVLHSSEAGTPGRLPTRGELRRRLQGDTVRVPDRVRA